MHPARIVEVLREIDADVIALQEVLSTAGDAEEDQAQYIATELGFHFRLGENRRLDGGAYGNLLLSRFPLRASQNHNITTQGCEQRGCLRADIDLDTTTLHVFNVHLGTSFFERRQQARKLISSRSCTIRGFMARGLCLGTLMSGLAAEPRIYLIVTFRAWTSVPIWAVLERTQVYFLSFTWIISISIRR